MRVDFGGQREKSKVRRTDRADPAVRLRNMLNQPIDGVVRIGTLVDARMVERSDDRTVHDELPFGMMHAADVLVDPDVIIVDKVPIHHRKDVVDALAGNAPSASLRIIGRAREQDRSVVRVLTHYDDSVELHAVAHRNHHDTLDVVGLSQDRVVGRHHVRRHRSDDLRCGGAWRGCRNCEEREEQNGEAERVSGHEVSVSSRTDCCKRNASQTPRPVA